MHLSEESSEDRNIKSLELELQRIVGCSWVLGTKLGFSARTVGSLNH